MYCEKCRRIIAENRCPYCKKSKVREPEPKDPCFLTEQGYLQSGILADVLKQSGIPFLQKDVMGAGMAIKVGPMLERSRFYVPLEQLADATAVVDGLFSAPEEEKEEMMNTEKELYIKEMIPGVYLMDEAHEATGYLVVGEEKACVIDTMNGYNDLHAAVRRITDKPVIVINTHGHPDHIFGNVYFDRAFLHPADRPLARTFAEEPEFVQFCAENHLRMPPFEDVCEGDVFDLGGRHLEVYELPGHTPGGIVLLLREDRILFTGDSVNHHLWMQLDGCAPMDEFVRNLDRIMFLETRADRILHGHARDFDDISLLRCLRQGAQELAEGKTENDLPYRYFGGEARQHPFTCLPGRRYSQEDHVICYRA